MMTAKNATCKPTVISIPPKPIKVLYYRGMRNFEDLSLGGCGVDVFLSGFNASAMEIYHHNTIITL